MPERNLVATRIAYLELTDERRMVREGHALLDEKRMLLAAELLDRLRRYRTLRGRWLDDLAGARAALAAAVRRHGLDGVTTHPGRVGALVELRRSEQRLLGLPLVEAQLETTGGELEFPPAETSPEITACATRFAALARQAAELAGLSVSLRILARDYRRTERRARALENVILPEIESDIRFMDGQLEAVEQEETVRVREVRQRAAAAGA
jgi:V/A-type H+-transporting ATPase subunit D